MLTVTVESGFDSNNSMHNKVTLCCQVYLSFLVIPAWIYGLQKAWTDWSKGTSFLFTIGGVLVLLLSENVYRQSQRLQDLNRLGLRRADDLLVQKKKQKKFKGSAFVAYYWFLGSTIYVDPSSRLQDLNS